MKQPEDLTPQEYAALTTEAVLALRKRWGIDSRATTPNGAPFPLRSWPPDAAIDIQLLAEWADKLGMWQAYTPTVGGALTIGNGQRTGWYTKIGRTVHFRAQFTLGSTSAMGSGFITYGVPVPYAGGFYGTAQLVSAGVMNVWASVWVDAISVNTPSNHADSFFGPTAPFTWKNSDQINISGTYESAS